MTWTRNRCFVTLAILCLWRVQELAEACSCSRRHPQVVFCSSDVVIRAKVVGKQEVDVGNDVYGDSIKRLKYEIKQIKMFKGPSNAIDAFYTAHSSAMCGVSLETNSRNEYLISGMLEADGTMYVTMCGLIEPWDGLTATQKMGVTERYQMGCECRINSCPSIPCVSNSPSECLWTDWVMEKTDNGGQAKNYSCIKRSDNSCAWYRGSAQPKKDFMDIEDP